jgi:hypothetical protein
MPLSESFPNRIHQHESTGLLSTGTQNWTVFCDSCWPFQVSWNCIHKIPKDELVSLVHVKGVGFFPFANQKLFKSIKNKNEYVHGGEY